MCGPASVRPGRIGRACAPRVQPVGGGRGHGRQLNDPVQARAEPAPRRAGATGLLRAGRAHVRPLRKRRVRKGRSKTSSTRDGDKHKLADMLFDCVRRDRRTLISLDSSTTMVRAVCLVDQITFDRIERNCVSLNIYLHIRSATHGIKRISSLSACSSSPCIPQPSP